MNSFEQPPNFANFAFNCNPRPCTKGDKLGLTDHSSVEYTPFRKNFYIESYEIARMTKVWLALHLLYVSQLNLSLTLASVYLQWILGQPFWDHRFGTTVLGQP